LMKQSESWVDWSHLNTTDTLSIDGGNLNVTILTP